tara:strand:- start:247 stop:1137 length:891 start_codon:yes stop_codon:yes gene_type:complete
MADYKYAFDYGVYDVTNMGDPQPINVPDNGLRGGEFPLSATNNSFILLSAGKVGGSPVEGVLFNYQASASAASHESDNVNDRFSLMSPGHGSGNTKSTAQIQLTSNGSNMEDAEDSPKLTLTDSDGTAITFTGVLTAPNYSQFTFSLSAATGGQGERDYYNMKDLVACINSVASLDMTASLFRHFSGRALLKQGTAGSAGNTTITLAAPITGFQIIHQFQGGHEEHGNPTIVLAAGGASGYHAASAAVMCEDGNSVLYCFEHSSSIAVKGALGATLSGFNLATGPNLRRLTALGYR